MSRLRLEGSGGPRALHQLQLSSHLGFTRNLLQLRLLERLAAVKPLLQLLHLPQRLEQLLALFLRCAASTCSTVSIARSNCCSAGGAGGGRPRVWLRIFLDTGKAAPGPFSEYCPGAIRAGGLF
jgi:hypothetical protein